MNYLLVTDKLYYSFNVTSSVIKKTGVLPNTKYYKKA